MPTKVLVACRLMLLVVLQLEDHGVRRCRFVGGVTASRRSAVVGRRLAAACNVMASVGRQRGTHRAHMCTCEPLSPTFEIVDA